MFSFWVHQVPRFVSPEGIEIPCFVVNDVPYIHHNIYLDATVGEISDSAPDDEIPSDCEGLLKQRMNFDKGYDYLGRRRGRPLKKEAR